MAAEKERMVHLPGAAMRELPQFQIFCSAYHYVAKKPFGLPICQPVFATRWMTYPADQVQPVNFAKSGGFACF